MFNVRTALTILVVLATAPAAHGQTVPACLAKAQMKEVLKARYKETPAGLGLVSKHHTQGEAMIAELFTAEEGRTWTVVLTSAAGRSCIATSGTSWIDLEPE